MGQWLLKEIKTCLVLRKTLEKPRKTLENLEKLETPWKSRRKPRKNPIKNTRKTKRSSSFSSQKTGALRLLRGRQRRSPTEADWTRLSDHVVEPGYTLWTAAWRLGGGWGGMGWEPTNQPTSKQSNQRSLVGWLRYISLLKGDSLWFVRVGFCRVFGFSRILCREFGAKLREFG